MKQRVNRCLHRLSDRDTEAMAANELDAIARGLDADELPLFLAAVCHGQGATAAPLAAPARAARRRPPARRRGAARAQARRRRTATSARSSPPRSRRRPPSRPPPRPPTSPTTSSRSSRASSSYSAAPPSRPSLRSSPSSAPPRQPPTTSAATAVPCLHDALAGDDWAARKAAAEALALLALEHGDDLSAHKPSCIAVFEAKRFDKVKIVRESMNRMIEAWREIPDLEEDVCSSGASPAQTRSSSLTDSASDGRYQLIPLAPIPSKKSSPPSRGGDVTVAADATPTKTVTGEKLLKEGNVRARLEARKMLFQKSGEKGYNKVAGRKSGSRVVPYNGDGDSEESTEVEDDGPEEFQSDNSDELQLVHKDEDLSKIRMQLVQIENQQTNLLDLLQKFMGSSQNGIRSLETRVNGLEMALDEISRDLAASSGRMPSSEPDMNCCIPSPKFWRKNDGGRYTSRYPVSDLANHSEEVRASHKWERQKFGVQGRQEAEFSPIQVEVGRVRGDKDAPSES
ncbi:hypothetical protein ZWY2020_049499 [Hordeum vulgare]|nr:hypothetical protein ZWY2020_049499 [Hordeum vulgare]